MKQYKVNWNDSNQRVDRFVAKVCKYLPKSMLHKYIRTKRIKVNGKRCEASQRLLVGDIVSMYINDEYFPSDTALKTAIEVSNVSTNNDLSIVYNDSHILIVNKPVGLVVHTDDRHSSDTLIDKIKRYLIYTGEYCPNRENSFSPALCNRIDRNTSGLVICAKDSSTLRSINLMIKENRIHKTYLCIVVSSPPKLHDTIVAYHRKDSRTNIVSIVDSPKPNYKQIITEYRVLNENNGLYLLEVKLITGRTHQIRAHLAHIGCALLGDSKYGNLNINRRYNEEHQLLCSHSLEFFPNVDEPISYLKGKTFKCNDIPFLKRYGF